MQDTAPEAFGFLLFPWPEYKLRRDTYLVSGGIACLESV